MAYFHKNLTQEKWNSLEKSQQILNIYSELNRANNWINQANQDYTQKSLERAFELIDLTVGDRKKWTTGARKEFLRLKESLAEYYINQKNITNNFIILLKVLLKFNKLSAQIII